MKKVIPALALSLTLSLAGSSVAMEYLVTNNKNDGPGSLQKAVLSSNADENDSNVITVQEDIKTILLDGELTFTKPTTLNGNGVTLKSNGTARIAHVTHGDMVVFRDITFTGGRDIDSGGAVRVSGASSAKFINCTFFDNNAGVGGAVSIASSNYKTSFQFCSIAGNSATSNGGGVAILDGGANFFGTIITGNTVTASNSQSTSHNDLYLNPEGRITYARYNFVGDVPGDFPAQNNSTGLSGERIFSTKPLALEYVDNVQVLKLNATSPARDCISESTIMEITGEEILKDERGAARKQLANVDAGAFEAGPILLISADIEGTGNYILVGSNDVYKVNVYPPDATLNTRDFPPDGIEWIVGGSGIEVNNPGHRETSVTATRENARTTLTARVHYWQDATNVTSREVKAELIPEIYTGNLLLPTVTVSMDIKDQNLYLDDPSIALTPEVKISMTTTEGRGAIPDVKLPYKLDAWAENPSILNVEVPNQNTQWGMGPQSIYLRGWAVGATSLDVNPVIHLKADTSFDIHEVVNVTVSQRTSGGGGGGCSAGFAGVSLLAALALMLRRK